jgi:hypothetical protein
LIRLHRREKRVQPNPEASREKREWHRQEPLLPRTQPLQPVLDPLKLPQATLQSVYPRVGVEDHHTQVVTPFAEALLHFAKGILL